jgi:hypothetical protein
VKACISAAVWLGVRRVTLRTLCPQLQASDVRRLKAVSSLGQARNHVDELGRK